MSVEYKSPPLIVALCEQYYLDRENPQSRQNLANLMEFCIRNAYEGDSEAQFLMGILYSCGIILEKDLKKSFGWYEASARNGYFEAIIQVMNCYEIGEGVEQNRFMYLYWKEKKLNVNHQYERFHSESNTQITSDLIYEVNKRSKDGEYVLKLSDGDLIASNEILKKCPFLSNYLKAEWKPMLKESGRFVIDMKCIEKCLPFILGPCLEMYLNFLNNSPNSNQICKLICQHSELWNDFLHLLNYFSNDDCIIFHYINDPLLTPIKVLEDNIGMQKFKNEFIFFLDPKHYIFIFKFTNGRIMAYNIYSYNRMPFNSLNDDCVESITCIVPSQFK